MYTKYTIKYVYGCYAGTRVVTLSDEDERNPIDVMWAKFRQEDRLTLGMASKSAKIIEREELESEDESI